jgi:thiosulfate dehydrogenase (quinone) large subunit
MADIDTTTHGARDRGRSHAASPGRWSAKASRHPMLPLRLFLSVTYIYAGLDKLSSSHYLAGAADSASFVAQTQAVKGSSPIAPLLDAALKAPTPFALAMAFGELAVGLGALLGLWTRLAALGGALISLSLWLTVSWQVHPYYLGNDLVYLVAWTPLLLGGAPRFSLDAVLARRSARERSEGAREGTVRRRALIDGGVAAVAVAGLGLLSGSLAARLGRRGGTVTTVDTAGSAGSAAPSGQPSASAAGDGSGNVSGDAVKGVTVAAADVPVGGAAKTTDPATGDAVFVLQPKKGTYTALSAVCPHAQCVVNTPKDGKLICPCHNSEFDAATGALLAGPATRGLAKYGLTRSGDRLRLGAKQT